MFWFIGGYILTAAVFYFTIAVTAQEEPELIVSGRHMEGYPATVNRKAA